MLTVIYFAPEKSSRMMWLLLGMVLFLPVPYLYDTQPWFKFRFKFCVYYLWLTFMSFLMIPLSLARPCSVANAVLGAKLMIPLSGLLGLDWEVRGETDLLKRPEACVVVANHQSSIDVLGMFVIWGRLQTWLPDGDMSTHFQILAEPLLSD
jgi:lysophosphatidate acyltransferase